MKYKTISVDGEKIELGKKIGKGLFAKVYEDPKDFNYVIIVTNADDNVKEIYAQLTSYRTNNSWEVKEPIKYIPFTEILGNVDRTGERVFRQKRYFKLDKNSPANKLANWLILINKKFWKTISSEERIKTYNLVGKFMDFLRVNNYPEDLYESLDYIQSWNQEEYGWEFSKRNLAQDENGELVLLDVIFDSALTAKIREKQRKQYYEMKMRGY